MAKLTYLYRSNEENFVKITRRQIPLNSSENLMMLMDLNSKGLVFDHPAVKGRELEEFTKKYKLLTTHELKQSLQVSSSEFTSVLSQNVPCVGCRRSVERLFYQLMLSGHPTLDPVMITNKGILTVTDDKIRSPQAICTLLHKHNILLKNLLENQPRNKKSSRCSLHSLDSFRSRPFSEMWRDVWNCMKQQCKDEIAVVEAQELHTTLDNYLKKHKFCQECRTKVEKAYSLLVNESNPNKEKGYVASLYSGIKRCLSDKHIHLQTKIEYIDGLIKRAEPELNGSNSRHRERHAKTLEIAQEEVLTCIGMCIYERLRRIHVCLREEENACQVLAAVAVHALCRSFDMAVENKQGISNLELLYEEISREERTKEQKKEQKKLKKRKKRNERKNNQNESRACNSCEPDSVADDDDDDVEIDKCQCSADEEDQQPQNRHNKNGNRNKGMNNQRNINKNEDADHEDDEDEDIEDDDEEKIILCDGTVIDATMPSTKIKNLKNSVSSKCCQVVVGNSVAAATTTSANATANEDVKDEVSVGSCRSCENNNDTSNICTQASVDGGYGSSPTSSIVSSPEGSEIACSDGCCNHDQSSPSSIHHNSHSMSTTTGKVETRRCSSRNTPDNLHTNGTGYIELAQMLDHSDDDDGDDDKNYLPDELIIEYKSRDTIIKQQRAELRKQLLNNFKQLCVKTLQQKNTDNNSDKTNKNNNNNTIKTQ
uniref:Gametogenetin-binding protein 2-like n=1 Tax=Corethrella appendiculata TaxID=1370023 RepID=U5EZT6_9DIPT